MYPVTISALTTHVADSNDENEKMKMKKKMKMKLKKKKNEIENEVEVVCTAGSEPGRRIVRSWSQRSKLGEALPRRCAEWVSVSE